MNATFIIEKAAETTAKMIAIARKIIVESQNPRPMNSSATFVAGKEKKKIGGRIFYFY